MIRETSDERNENKTILVGKRRKKWSLDDANRWAEKYRRRVSVLKIAREEGADPGTVSAWLRKVGISLKQGQHFVGQPELRIPDSIVKMLLEGSEAVRNIVEARIYGAMVTSLGYAQLKKYCAFLKAYEENKGVEEIGRLLHVQRSTVANWRNGKDVPYLAKLAVKAVEAPMEGWQWLPTHLEAGGNEQSGWIQVPRVIVTYSDIVDVVNQLKPLSSTYERAQRFGLDKQRGDAMRPELFSYLLGFMLGDAGKSGGVQLRFTSMNLDLQLSCAEKSNERLGEFVSLCANSLGIVMERHSDKMPTGDTALAEQATPAYRWTSSRSPLIAWMFQVALGLKPGQLTSVNEVMMEWILSTPDYFRKRFIQGIADSDGTTRKYAVEIASMPNANLITTILLGLGLKGARNLYERGKPIRSSVPIVEAAKLPIFNELAVGHRYKLMIRNAEILGYQTR